jgi:putative ABC transport system permease protein
MMNYYFRLALHSLRRNVVLTTLMVAAVGVGIGTSMTMLTIFRAMAQDPIPQKSARLFVPQIDNWGPFKKRINPGDDEHLPVQLSYIDAIAFMNARAAYRQAAMYATGGAVIPPNPQLRPFQVQVRATYADFLSMFDVPFLYGGPWSASDDAGRANVAVITRELNDKVFGGANSVGMSIYLDNRDYRIVGVADRWAPTPKFYDLNGGNFDKSEVMFLPLTRAIDLKMPTWGNVNCAGDVSSGWEARLQSECVWFQFWAELPTAADVARYRAFLSNYGAEQRRVGRFQWPARTRLHDVRQWLVRQHVVSDEVRILVLVSFSFLFVCLLNAAGLMLAKMLSRSADIGVRRALGANRGAIFSQCLMEAAVIGLAGGLLGLALTALGLFGLRSLLSEQIVMLAHLGAADISIALALAVGATMAAGLYPTWRAAQIQPAWQLKAQ